MKHNKPDHRWYLLTIMLIIKTENNNINYTIQQMFNLGTGLSKSLLGELFECKDSYFNQAHAKEKNIIWVLLSLNNPC